jgi:hypothetical protein
MSPYAGSGAKYGRERVDDQIMRNSLSIRRIVYFNETPTKYANMR